ncbi:helix-turn-helix domain-containing protein [Puerhibacterium sp. TATVAM-FAB25]|uniref:helix-turn-helix domain-containing protein n=1 Tax=Puerhibacterium sp. TATVAM-FAB25 TaxID=3093699 RepID=UPI003978C1EC
MPRRSGSYRTPREWVAEGSWPDGSFADDSPTAVAYAVEIARRLERSIGDRSKASLAREANIERSTLYDLLSGRSWPDAITIAQLEQALQARLWPDHPVPMLTDRSAGKAESEVPAEGASTTGEAPQAS